MRLSPAIWGGRVSVCFVEADNGILWGKKKSFPAKSVCLASADDFQLSFLVVCLLFSLPLLLPGESS